MSVIDEPTADVPEDADPASEVAPETAAGDVVADEQPSQRSAGWLAFVIFVLLGLGVRGTHAWSLGPEVGAWESDGFLVAWEGHPWGAWNRLRPPGHPWVLGQLGGSLQPGSRFEVRLISIGLALLALLAVVDAASRLSRGTSMTRRSVGRAAGWMAAIWAVHPTLVASSVAPTPETLLGASLCVLLAGLGRLVSGSRSVGWLAVCAGGLAAMVTGGVGIAMALAVGAIVFLVPIPKLTVSLTTLAGLGLVLGLAWTVQRGPDAERPWLPDTANARSLKVLTDAPHSVLSDMPTHADLRERQMLSQLAEGLDATGASSVAAAVLGRCVNDQLNPGRFREGVRAAREKLGVSAGDVDDLQVAAVVGWFDLFLRGGLLLFVFTVVGLLKPRAESCWPRAGSLVGACVLLVALVAGAIGPFALAPLDLVLLATAGAGVAGTDPSRPWTRRLAFLVGGTLMCTLLLTGGLAAGPLSTWATNLAHVGGEGRQLIDLIEPDSADPSDALGQVRAAELMMFPTAPLLRHPEAALAHAEAAVLADPASDRTTEILVRAQVENGLYEDAARLAEGLRAPIGTESRKSLILLDWVQDEQRRMLNLPRRR